MPNIKKINNEFENGYIPNELFYSVNKRDIDINKITYNDTYKSFEYHARKIPFYKSIPGLDQVIQNIADTTLSPLEELELKCINVVSNLLTYNINKSNPNNQSILCCIPITTQPNSIIEYKNNNNFRSNLFINQISNIVIKLMDQNSNILDLNGLDFFLTIQLDIERFN